NKLWEKECRILGVNEPEKHEVRLRQIKCIRIPDPVKRGETPPNPPTLTTPTTLIQPETTVPIIPPVATTDVASATTDVAAADQPATPADQPPAAEHLPVSNPAGRQRQVKLKVNRTKEVK